jgi:hypothetical protein
MKKTLMTKFLFLATLLAMISNSYAGGLMVTPSRLVFDKDNKNLEVKLINKSDKTVTYRVNLQHLRMNEDGSYTEILTNETDVKEKFADDLLRFSPRKVVLKPNEVQTIRIATRYSNSDPDGEYRSHLLLREEPSADFKQANDVEATAKKGDDKKISIVLRPLFGISIPIIVKKGDLSASGRIENVKVQTDTKDTKKKYLSLDVLRNGDSSLYGDILIGFKDNKTGKKYDIGTLSGVAVFSPYPKRTIKISLDIPKGVELRDGQIDVRYVDKTQDGKTSKIISKSMLDI